MNKYEQFINESKREKIFLNGYECWLDRENLVLYDKEYSKNGLVFDTDGISIWSSHLTKDEKRQLLDYLKFGRQE